MYISNKNKNLLKSKFSNKCAYSGTELLNDFQFDHIKPIRRKSYVENTDNHNLENIVPCQKIINHYKHTYDLEIFRQMIKTLHLRIVQLPKNPRTEKSKKHKEYLLKVANFFNITSENSFDGEFYFEKIST